MQFETFRGRDVAEAVARVKAAYGPNAVIASTRHVANGRAQGSSFVEVKAAPGAEPKRAAFVREVLRKDGTPVPPSPVPLLQRKALPVPARDTPPPAFAAPAPAPAVLVTPTPQSNPELEAELRRVRAMVEELQSAARPRGRASRLLRDAGIEGALAREIAQGAASLPKGADVRAWLKDELAARLTLKPSPVDEPGPRVVACVGPTGVGKTTTIAKLAARARLDGNRSVAVISLDTFRVGAIEQMRRFVELIDVPLHVAHGKEDFAAAVSSMHGVDVILVDTASRAPSDRVAMGLLRECLATADWRPIDVLLTLPASIRARDVERLHSVHETCPPTGLCITKLDETDQIGGTVHAALRGKLPLVYLCRGPRVPEDFEDATMEGYLDLLLPENLP
jgi:flagellar biosynthesis protein FlhF